MSMHFKAFWIPKVIFFFNLEDRFEREEGTLSSGQREPKMFNMS